MLFNIPYYSQHRDVRDPLWQKRACGVACLKMLIETSGVETPPLDEMILEGVALGAYSEHGWTHEGLISLGATYGGAFARKEFKSKDADEEEAIRLNKEGIDMILSELKEGRPIIVSAIKNFELRDKFHLVLIVGVETEDGAIKGFYYHDPDHDTEEDGAYQFVSFEIFMDTWRRMAIFIKE